MLLRGARLVALLLLLLVGVSLPCRVSVRVETWTSLAHSYAQVGQSIALALAEVLGPNCVSVHEAPVLMDMFPGWTSLQQQVLPENRAALLGGLKRAGPSCPDVIVRSFFPLRITPPLECPLSRLFVMGTTEMGVAPAGIFLHPGEDWQNLPPLVHIVTPSAWAAKGFVDSGVPLHKLLIVPHGVHISSSPHPSGVAARASLWPQLQLSRMRWSDQRLEAVGNKLDLERDERCLWVGSLGSMTTNKGMDLLLAGFAAATQTLSGAKGPCLRLCLKGISSLYNSERRLESYFEFVESSYPSIRVGLAADALVWSGASWKAEQVDAFLRGLDVYAAPYRGEGFGMPVLEAAAAGVPSIVTGGGATDEFVSSAWAIRIPSTLEPMKVLGQDGFGLEANVTALRDVLVRLALARWCEDEGDSEMCGKRRDTAPPIASIKHDEPFVQTVLHWLRQSRDAARRDTARQWTWRRAAMRLLDAVPPQGGPIPAVSWWGGPLSGSKLPSAVVVKAAGQQARISLRMCGLGGQGDFLVHSPHLKLEDGVFVLERSLLLHSTVVSSGSQCITRSLHATVWRTTSVLVQSPQGAILSVPGATGESVACVIPPCALLVHIVVERLREAMDQVESVEQAQQIIRSPRTHESATPQWQLVDEDISTETEVVLWPAWNASEALWQTGASNVAAATMLLTQLPHTAKSRLLAGGSVSASGMDQVLLDMLGYVSPVPADDWDCGGCELSLQRAILDRLDETSVTNLVWPERDQRVIVPSPYLQYRGADAVKLWQRGLELLAANAGRRPLPQTSSTLMHLIVSESIGVHSVGKLFTPFMLRVARALHRKTHTLAVLIPRCVSENDQLIAALQRAVPVWMVCGTSTGGAPSVEPGLHRLGALPSPLKAAAAVIAQLNPRSIVFTDVGIHAMSTTLAAQRLCAHQLALPGFPGVPGPAHAFPIDAWFRSPWQSGQTPFVLSSPGGLAASPSIPPGSVAIPTDGGLIFVPHTQAKLSIESLSLLLRVLQDNPRAVAVVLDGTGPSWSVATRYRASRLDPAAAARMVFLPRLSGPIYASLLVSASLVWDTTPYGGVTTTIEAAGAGVGVANLSALANRKGPLAPLESLACDVLNTLSCDGWDPSVEESSLRRVATCCLARLAHTKELFVDSQAASDFAQTLISL
jgi:glycosyltransferase involved in cell wall biosynthesis